MARIALERMSQQLKSAIPASIAEEDGRRRPAFESGEDRIRFVTVLPVGVDSRPAQVSYSIEQIDGERRLVYREYPWPDKNFFAVGEPVKEEALDGIVGMAIALRPRRERGVIEESSPPRDEEGQTSPGEDAMPGGVEISLSLAGDDGDGDVLFSTSVSLQSEPWR